jgi:hypothetical protein
MPQIQSLTGKSPLDRLEQSLSMANDQYAQGRQQEFSLGQELQNRAKKRKEENFVQGNIQNALEFAMTPNEEGKFPDESTVKSKVFNTGLALLMGGGETGKQALPILDKLVTTMLPVRKRTSKYEPHLDDSGNVKTVKVGNKTVALEHEVDDDGNIRLNDEGKPILHYSKEAYQPPAPKGGRSGGSSTSETLKAMGMIKKNADAAVEAGARLTDLDKGALKDKNGNLIDPNTESGKAVRKQIEDEMRNYQQQVYSLQNTMGWNITSGEKPIAAKDIHKTVYPKEAKTAQPKYKVQPPQEAIDELKKDLTPQAKQEFIDAFGALPEGIK